MKTAIRERPHDPGSSSDLATRCEGSENIWSPTTASPTHIDSCLSAIPSVLQGLLPFLDIGGTLLDDYPSSHAGYELDIAAFESDWILVGQDIYCAFLMYPESE